MQILHGHKMTMYCSVKCLPQSQGYNYYIVRLLSLPVLHTINKLSEFPDLLFHRRSRLSLCYCLCQVCPSAFVFLVKAQEKFIYLM